MLTGIEVKSNRYKKKLKRKDGILYVIGIMFTSLSLDCVKQQLYLISKWPVYAHEKTVNTRYSFYCL